MTTLPPEIIARLNSGGFTAGWLAERMGIKRPEAVKLLTDAGAVSRGGKYCLPGYAPPRTYGSDRACVPSERSGVAFGSARDVC
jgi:hypothetical protein